VVGRNAKTLTEENHGAHSANTILKKRAPRANPGLAVNDTCALRWRGVQVSRSPRQRLSATGRCSWSPGSIARNQGVARGRDFCALKGWIPR